MTWSNGILKLIESCCGGSARDLNNCGGVIGDECDVQGRYHAFYWTPKRGAQAMAAADGFSSAVAINDHGHAIVQTSTVAFIYSSGKLEALQLDPRYPSHPRSINDCDEIVGSFGPYADKDRAFRWDRTRGFRDLSEMIPPDSGWHLQSATALNDGGEIVGSGNHGDTDTGFLLVPSR